MTAVKISELARQADVPLAMVKYYQREGLLPAWEKSAPNQASYSDAHVQRLRLIRALMGTGGLSISATKDVIATLDAGSLMDTFWKAQQAMNTPRSSGTDPDPKTKDRIRRLAASRGWDVWDDNPGIDVAARALDGLEAVGFVAPDAYLAAYAEAASIVAAADMSALESRPTPAEVAELMVVGTVLGDALLAGLRRMAHEHAAHGRFPAQE